MATDFSRHSRRLSNFPSAQIEELLTDESILILPIGAIEQHGPHLPVNTDLVIAQAAAEALATQCGERLNAWLLEPLAYTKSNEHAGSPGTVWLGPETMLRVLDDIGRSLAATPARKLVLLNGHGGNSSLLNVASRELHLHHGLDVFLMHPVVPPDQGGPSSESELGMGIHAGLGETSMMLYLAPELVQMEHAARSIPEHLSANQHVRFGGAVSFGWLARDFDDSGVIGDPTEATADLGKQHFEAAIDLLVDALDEVATFRFRTYKRR